MSDCTYQLVTGKEGIVMTSHNSTTSRCDIERLLRVYYAGERTAQLIYKCQLAVLANHEIADEIQHMME
jgi:demethoxyubiquinone hydroxylase (CLK1/Coq7/Cat5 family)